MTPEISRSASKNTPLVHRKILLVDESLRDLQYYAAILQWQGHEVRIAASYAEGRLAIEREHFDFVIVNQGSRQFEGRALVQRALEIERRLPVLSAYLGHVHWSDTYWYLSALPELMHEAVSRLEQHWEDRS